MPTKTITLELGACETLRRAKRHPRESFSEVVRRSSTPGQGITGRELLDRIAEGDRFLADLDLDTIEELSRSDRPPEIP